MTVELVAIDTVYRGWVTLSVARFRLSNGAIVKREIENHGNAIAVLPFDESRGVAMLVRQFRAPAFTAAGEPGLLEVIAGLIEESDPADAARREAREEAGIVLGALDPVGTVWTMPGLSTERMTLYLARYESGDRREPGGGSADEHEFVEAIEIPLTELAREADAARIADMKTFALIQSLRLRRPDLFRVR